ncbi:5004_t:CDS:2 [Acaulospora morrowiae]|uniref:5004_t:CDS:1 n=1 Tax=Acaulospora morrowiae TaxID=94023 RepID=A0A9N9GJA3_9GLOM|nr:5004_t:CDS:2 [Acaulospora morrowiae]
MKVEADAKAKRELEDCIQELKKENLSYYKYEEYDEMPTSEERIKIVCSNKKKTTKGYSAKIPILKNKTKAFTGKIANK